MSIGDTLVCICPLLSVKISFKRTYWKIEAKKGTYERLDEELSLVLVVAQNVGQELNEHGLNIATVHYSIKHIVDKLFDVNVERKERIVGTQFVQNAERHAHMCVRIEEIVHKQVAYGTGEIEIVCQLITTNDGPLVVLALFACDEHMHKFEYLEHDL